MGSRLKTNRRRDTKTPPAGRYAADLLPVEALSRDGLLVRSDGTFLRYVEVIPRNPLVLDDGDCERLSRGFTDVLSVLPAGQDLQIYVEARPVRLDDLVARGRRDTEHTITLLLASGDPDLIARGQALARLAAAHEESLSIHAQDQAAVEIRYLVVIPWIADLPLPTVGQLRSPIPAKRKAGSLTRDLHSHLRIARETLQHADAICGELQALGMTATLLDGSDVADALWRRFAPHAAHATPELAPSRRASRLLGALDAAHDAAQAHRAAQELAASIAAAALDFDADHRWGVIDGGLEQTIHLSGVPEDTFVGWALHAMQTAKPWVLSVHVSALDRHSERARARAASRRLWGVNRSAAMPNHDQLDHEAEKQQLIADLKSNQAPYRMSFYLTIREAGPLPDAIGLSESVDQAIRAIAQPVEARVARGEFEQQVLWQSSLPLALDPAGDGAAKRSRKPKYVARNVADSLPLVGTSCGSPDGIPFAYADPGRTVEHINPRDPLHDNGTLIVCAKSGGGKTMTVQALISNALARGAAVNVIDRAGHYAPLCSAIPGAAHLSVSADANTVNPWDVPDPANVPTSKVAFLRALHALLIGDHDGGIDGPGLDPTERSLLELAIRGVYARAATDGLIACESLLRDELHARAQREADDPAGGAATAAVYRSLAERLHPYCGDGAYGYLLDRPTTIGADDAPLIVFDTRHVPEDISPAVLFSLAEFIQGRVERRWEDYLRRHGSTDERTGMFDGMSVLVLEELWKLTERRATGQWVNELARRARHLGLFLICISQQRSDLAGPYGKALLNNCSMQLHLKQSSDELEAIAEAAKLSREEVRQIEQLKTEKRRYAQAFFINGARGRGTVSIRVGPRIYWLATSDPIHDAPIRERALHEAGGDMWAALDLLADPAWHRAHDFS